MFHHDLVTLRLFNDVCDMRNIAHAAKANNIAASAISKRISDLETQTNSTLLFRSRDGVSPTPAGDVVYRQVKCILAGLEQLDKDLIEFTNGKTGLVRIWANNSAINQFIPKDIASFLQHFPDVKLRVYEETSRANIAAVRNGNADFSIFLEHEHHEGIHTRIYKQDTLVIITSKNHPLSSSTKAGLVETLDYNHVGLHEESTLQAKIKNEAFIIGREVEMNVRVSGFDNMLRMVSSNMGIAIIPRGAIPLQYEDLNISIIDLDEIWAKRRLLIGYRDLDTLSSVAKMLVQHLAPL